MNPKLSKLQKVKNSKKHNPFKKKRQYPKKPDIIKNHDMEFEDEYEDEWEEEIQA